MSNQRSKNIDFSAQKVEKRGHEGIEPSTSPTLKENHTTRPMAHAFMSKIPGPATVFLFSINQKLLGVGFEPTHPKILELESSALDRSAIQATGNRPKLRRWVAFLLC